MAASPTPSIGRRAASPVTSVKKQEQTPSASSSPQPPAVSDRRRNNSDDDDEDEDDEPEHQDDDDHDAPSISIDTMVNHLLAAKRSLSSMTHVLHANEIAEQVRAWHEDERVMTAQTGFMRTSVVDQVAILVRIRDELVGTYDWGKRDFKKLVRVMDESDAALERTMSMLRETTVQRGLRPEGEAGQKTLLDFIDEESVHGLRNAMKKSIEELQKYQQSFDGDLLRFDTDIRNLRSMLSDTDAAADADANTSTSMTDRLDTVIDHSSNMAQLLASLTNHFDMCVTAIRTTEGAAAVARRKAADADNEGEGAVSISGVIAEQESNLSALEPKTAADRAEMLKVVVQDAAEVGDVVQEMQDRLAAMDAEAEQVRAQTQRARTLHAATLDTCTALNEVGDRLAAYTAAADDFRQRWELEKTAVHDRLREMGDLTAFYERYAGAYDSLVLEVERRRAVEERVAATWRKAHEAVDKMMRADREAREAFRNDVGEFLPTDLWEDMQGPARTYKVVEVEEGKEE